MKITKISPAAKTKNRYNVFVDEQFVFSLDETQLVRLGLKKEQELSREEVEQLKTESNFGKSYIRAVDLISRRLRSEKEIRDYAYQKNWTKENTEQVIERLKDNGYLNDTKFAAAFVRSRAVLQNYSRRRMILELQKRGITTETINKVLNESEDYDELTALRNLIAKKHVNYKDERKLVSYLMRQGFNYDQIRIVLKEDLTDQKL